MSKPLLTRHEYLLEMTVARLRKLIARLETRLAESEAERVRLRRELWEKTNSDKRVRRRRVQRSQERTELGHNIATKLLSVKTPKKPSKRP